MSIANELARIQSAKTDLASAIVEKGGTVPTGALLDAFAGAVRALPSGGDTSVEDGMVIRTISEYTNARVSRIGPHAFGYCSSLTSVSFPACTNIGSYAFTKCSSLTNIFFQACESIRISAFISCTSLTFVSLPVCTNIDVYAFCSCYHLLSIYLGASTVCNLKDRNAFSSTPISNYTASTGGVYGSIFVPASLVSQYKTATNWTYFADRITAIPE